LPLIVTGAGVVFGDRAAKAAPKAAGTGYRTMQGRLLGWGLAALAAGASGVVALVAADSQAAPQCFGKRATIVGTNGNDTLNGTPGKDVIVARAGDDTIQSKSNDDRVCLGDGDDFAGTSRGFDKIDGGDGEDEIHGGGRAGQPDPGDGDLIIGGDDDDFLDGTRGELDDKIRGGPGNDRIQGAEFVEGGDGNDQITAEGHVDDNHRDRLFGDDGDDLIEADFDGSPAEIHGGAGADRLRGRNGNDEIFGDDDDDELRGNGGADRLDGGNGNDSCQGDATATKVACEI
jgi:Ca2+-binding RTX toxin-like protein